jgi:hypothetical protein
MTCKKLVDSQPASIGKNINVFEVVSSTFTFFKKHAEHKLQPALKSDHKTTMGYSRIVSVQDPETGRYTHISASVVNLTFHSSSLSNLVNNVRWQV